MPIKIKKTPKEWCDKIASELLLNWRDELTIAATNAGKAIVQTTLDGVGEKDRAFEPYSPSYLRKLATVGGKPHVDMRGVFYIGEGSRQITLREARAGRLRGAREQTGRIVVGGRAYIVTRRRPRLGTTDLDSEMSDDLISVVIKTDTFASIVYRERHKNYMVLHNEGTARGGIRRRWFTTQKAGVKKAYGETLQGSWRARIRAVMGRGV